MPARFVEVLDVSAEASVMVSKLAAQAGGLASYFKLNITSYINATSGHFDQRLVSVLEQYNMTKDQISSVMSSLSLDMSNTTLANIEKPKPVAGMLMAIGSVLILAHLIMVHVGSRRLMKKCGNHVE